MSDEEETHRLDLAAWQPQLPPPGFADGVLARLGEERHGDPPPERRATKRRPAIIAGAFALAAAAATVALLDRPPSRGDAIAADRLDVAIGSRARAVLEPGARVSWDGDDVSQPSGDVFYRVDRGGRFRVHTPAGDVHVEGTCFKVKVIEMHKRDLKSGAVGAALSALALVVVYEGKVGVSHAGQRAELGAGEAAQLLGEGGVVKTGAAEGVQAFEAKVEGEEAEVDPTTAANRNLVAQVSDYKRRLEAIAAQRTELEKKLATTEKQLEAAREGGSAAPAKHEFDLGPEDWKELARQGSVKALIPCMREKEWTPSPAKLNKLGLAPEDGGTIKAAYKYAVETMWSKIKPLCAAALGSVEAAENVGPSTCQFVVLDVERARNGDAAELAKKMVGEVRSGHRRPPGPNEPVSPVYPMFMAVTESAHDFEAQLAKSLGPEEAHRITYADEGLCFGTSHWR